VHICNDRAQFKNYEEVIDKKVLMGNHPVDKVLGQGTIELQLTSRKKLTLKNVLHVLEIRKNLISAFLLSKNDFKPILQSAHVVLSENGIFVGKGYTNDGMFKLNLYEINEINDVSVYVVDFSTLWHAKLAHLSFS